MSELFAYFVGIDLGGERHQVCLVSADGDVVTEPSFAHSGTGVEQLLNWLNTHTSTSPERVAVAVETTRGAVMEALLERQYAVFAVNPKQVDRFRDRFSVAGAKDDVRDAFVIARSLRTDRDCFRQVHIDAPEILRLRELSRAHDAIGEEFRRTANRLYSLLRRYFPELLTLAPAADEPWLWSLLELASLPAKASRLHRSRLKQLLAQHRIRRFNLEQLLAVLRAPALPMAPGAAEAIAEQVVLLLPRIRLVHKQRVDLERRINELLDDMASHPEQQEHRDVGILLSVPGIGKVVAAAVLSEAATAIADRNYPLLRGLAGVAPVTRRSGKQGVISMRYACNRRLRDALHHCAAVHLQHCDRAREHYHHLRERGHSHGRALRGVADRLLAVLTAMLKQQTLYNPIRRPVGTDASSSPGTPGP